MRTLFGVLLAGVMLVGAGCSSVEPKMSAPTVNVTGKWAGTWVYERQSLGQGELMGTFQQDGDRLSGNFTIIGTGGRVVPIVGFVSGNNIKLTEPQITNMTVSADGQTMTGWANGLDNMKINLKKQP